MNTLKIAQWIEARVKEGYTVECSFDKVVTEAGRPSRGVFYVCLRKEDEVTLCNAGGTFINSFKLWFE